MHSLGVTPYTSTHNLIHHDARSSPRIDPRMDARNSPRINPRVDLRNSPRIDPRMDARNSPKFDTRTDVRNSPGIARVTPTNSTVSLVTGRRLNYDTVEFIDGSPGDLYNDLSHHRARDTRSPDDDNDLEWI